jgi:putative oxidoreductase
MDNGRMEHRGILFKAGETSSPVALTALRVGLGITMVVHGWSKLMNVPAWTNSVRDIGIPLPEASAWLAIAGELLGGAGLLVGLMTPVAGFGLLCVMLTAIFSVHIGHGLLAKNNGFEFPMLIALVAAFFMARGAGPHSLDAAIVRALARRRARTPTRAPHPARI